MKNLNQKVTFKAIKIVFCWILALQAHVAQAHESFVALLKSITSNQPHVVTMVPNDEKYMSAPDFESAHRLAQQQTFPQLFSTESLSLESSQVSSISPSAIQYVQDLMRKKMTTIVIVPGLLAEFIDTRAFEDIFSKDSFYKKQWKSLSKNSKMKDTRFNLKKYAYEQESMANLIDAASIDDEQGRPLVKIIILKTFFGSLESIGDNVEKAKIFNRRLDMYTQMTHDENLVLLGYSRGTPLALEMIAQAEQNHSEYIKKVSAVVSHAGVVMGSALADITEDSATESGRIFSAVKELESSLVNSNYLIDIPVQFGRNTLAINKFLAVLALNSEFDLQNFLKQTMSGDFKTVAALVARMINELGVSSPLTVDFNGRVNRLRLFISEILKSVDGLKTKNALNWWKTHTLPKNIKYLSLAAGMVDPAKSATEKMIYNLKTGYNDTLDDDSLQGNRRTYEKATGVALNDSQVALHQTLFLPQVIASLNPANAGLSIQHLGLLQTHHWGVSLRTVNVMKDGRINPFPREKVIMSLISFLNQDEQ